MYKNRVGLSHCGSPTFLYHESVFLSQRLRIKFHVGGLDGFSA